jgi:RND family efflux transporter MFP subunit
MTHALRFTLLSSFLLTALPLSLSSGCRKTEAPEEPPPAPVEVEGARSVVFGEKTELVGTTQPLPRHIAQISSAVEARVLKVLPEAEGTKVGEGGKVNENQIIVQLDDRVPRSNRDKLAATLTDLEEQVNQAEFAFELAQIKVKSLDELNKEKPVGTALPLVSRVEMANAAVTLKDASSRKLSAIARAAAARAELAALDAQLTYYNLRAPIAGQLGLVRAIPGQNLAAGTQVAEVVDLDAIDVLCYAPPHAAGRLKLGQEVILAGAESAEHGTVVFIAPQAQPETGNFAVKVRFDHNDTGLRANTLVRVHVLTEPEQPRLCVSDTALMEDQDPPTLVVIDRAGKALKVKAVELGVRDRGKKVVELRKLVQAENEAEEVDIKEAKFVVKGAAGLHDGDEVELKERADEDGK